MCASRRARNRGVTLIELMTVIVIVAIFSSLAAPSFRQLIAQQRVKSATSALSESVWLARSEALKRNDNVSFTFTTAPAGWEINYTDSAGNTTKLLTEDGFPAVTSTLKNGSTGVFAFNPYGRLGGAQTIQFASASVSTVVKCVSVSTSGKTIVKDGACS